MVNEDVAYYLREGRKRGFGFIILKKKLLEGGYGNKDIDEAIELIKEDEKIKRKNPKKNKRKKQRIVKKRRKKRKIVKNRKRKEKRKMKIKRQVSAKTLKSVKNKTTSALESAISDLDNEIKRLGREKSNLKQNLGEVSSAIDVDRQKERELQNKIAKLIEKEAKLNEEKKNLETKIEKVSDRLSKISKIKSEMSDV